MAKKKDIETLRHLVAADIETLGHLVAADIETSWWWRQTLRLPGGGRHWDIWWSLVKSQALSQPIGKHFPVSTENLFHPAHVQHWWCVLTTRTCTGEMTPLRAMREVYLNTTIHTGVLSTLVVCTNIVLHFVDFLDLWVWQLCYPCCTEGSAATRWELASTILSLLY